MAKFIEVETTGNDTILLNIDEVERFNLLKGRDNNEPCIVVHLSKLKVTYLKLDWETLKSMLGDNLITLSKD
ncbi:hypothetical protein [uncultured Gilliamella sp.]|uniref:hypothetical protein n=1 Tax=uncultured Gilliamella sp. TaxID=1193505 RepID=UPI0025CC0751|nr:hypothetical protein [uncultured Gilliamella sp.]